MYENGLGVRKNRSEALRWYRKAADLNDANGRKNLRRLQRGSHLSPDRDPRPGEVGPRRGVWVGSLGLTVRAASYRRV
jgi:TPR repeat protein